MVIKPWPFGHAIAFNLFNLQPSTCLTFNLFNLGFWPRDRVQPV
ncbi:MULTISPECIES: hypothetical protein [Moorena]|nr:MULTISPECIES: hypothetical protein [Moorena]